MSKVVPFQGQLPAVPAYLKTGAAGLNDEFTAGLYTGFVAPPKLGTEGGKFHVIDSDGNDVVVTKADEEGNVVPVSILSVTVLGANVGKYKIFFGKENADGSYSKAKYDPNAEQERPICYSYDGIRPSPQVDVPQCATCAACPHDVWGSHVNELGNKTRACTDGKILAVIPTSSVTRQLAADTPGGAVYSLKLSPTSLSRSKDERKADPASAFSWTEYVGLLNAYPADGGVAQVPVRSVSTKLFFNLKAQYPLLQFKLGRFLTEAEIAYVTERAQGDDVKAIIEEQGQGPAPMRPPHVAAPAQLSTSDTAPPKPLPPPKPAVEDDGESDVTPVAAPPRGRGRPAGKAKEAGVAAAAAAPVPQTKAKVATADVDAEVAAVAAMFGD